MAPNVGDEVYANTTWTLVVKVAIETKWPKMSFKLFTEERRGLTTACIARFVRTEEDEIAVRTGAHAYTGGQSAVWISGLVS